MSNPSVLVSTDKLEKLILYIRDQKVMLDHDLAELYGVTTRILNQAVKRNSARFPKDFMFPLNKEEVEAFNRSQIVIGSQKHRDPRYPPYVFTEQGVAMLSGILNSPRAVQVNVEIMRTFVRLRQLLSSNAELAQKLHNLEQKYDSQFKVVFDAIRKMMEPMPLLEKKPIGFRASLKMT